MYEKNYTFAVQTPVFEIDGRKIGQGKVGSMLLRLRECYKALIRKDGGCIAI